MRHPWFVGKNVANILGYSNPQKAIRDHIDNEDKTVNELFIVNGTKEFLLTNQVSIVSSCETRILEIKANILYNGIII